MFIRDKYEKEPILQLIKGVLFGSLIAVPILKMEVFLTNFLVIDNKMLLSIYDSFIVAGFSEEFFKFLATFILFYRNRNFNERFDGIVYAVFVSLGFAMLENFVYVFNTQIGGMQTAILRAIISVPMHGLFGVFMGYYLSLYKFENYCHRKFIIYALIQPVLVHGLYDFILISELYFFVIPFLIFILYMIISSEKKMKIHLEKSPFK